VATGRHKRPKLKLGRYLAQSYQRRLGATGRVAQAAGPGLAGPPRAGRAPSRTRRRLPGGLRRPESERPGNLKPSPAAA
jgi:hypothetical protein